MTPEEGTDAFTVATEHLIETTIQGAAQRLVVAAPAVSCRLAHAICGQWRRLGPDHVTLILDSDPEVYRLGYGCLEALHILRQASTEVGATIRCQPGLRIGMIVSDDRTLIYMPTAQLVEAGPNTQGAANAIFLGHVPATVASDLGLEPGTSPQIGRSAITESQAKRITADLEANPPQRFDLARQVRVFSSLIEFVELKIQGTEMSRRTVTLPSHLLGVADAETQRELRATLRLVPKDHKLSGAAIENKRRLLEDEFLHVIPKFGTVVLVSQKDRFSSEVSALTKSVAAFAEAVRLGVQQLIDKKRADLIQVLMPRLKEQPPQHWMLPGEKLEEQQIAKLLERELKGALGTADQLVRTMRLRVTFKGVTYELLNDPEFREAAAKVIPALGDRLHTEFGAARSADGPPEPARR